MAAKKPPAPAIEVPWAELRALLGLPEDDPKVTKVLAKAGKVTWGKPDGGDRYAVAREAGFDLLCRRPDDAKRGAPKLVNTIFLMCEGRDKHRQFAKPPYGITFTTRADVLKAMPKPERTWKIGKGKVPVTTKDPDHDRWLIDDVFVSVDYGDDLSVRGIVVSTPRD